MMHPANRLRELFTQPLPSQWSYGVTEDGRVFFIDEESRITTWLHPVDGQAVQSGNFKNIDLPQGWEMNISGGRPYYVDHIKHITTFDVHGGTEHQDDETSHLSRGDKKRSSGIRRSSFKRRNSKKVVDKTPMVKRDPEAVVSIRGWMYKQEGTPLKTWKKRWFVLADFCLFQYKGPEEGQSVGCTLLPGYNIQVCDRDEDGITRKFAFKAEHENVKTVYFATDCIEDMHVWMQAMNQAATVQLPSGVVDAGRLNDRDGVRFQRSQSQNDLDRQTYDERFYSPTDLRSPASGFNIQRREADEKLRRHPSDVADRYRRSLGEWDGTRMPPAAVNNGVIPQTNAAEHEPQQMNQKLRTSSDPSRNLDSSRYGGHRDTEYQGDHDGQRLHSEGDKFQRSRENVADVTAVSKKPSVRNDSPKNRDIIDWLKRGDGGDTQLRDLNYNADGRDIHHSASNYNSSVNDRTGDKLSDQTGPGKPSHMPLSASRSYPATRSDGEVIASSRIGLQSSPTGPRTEGTVFQQFGVSNPSYDAGYRTAVSEQAPSSDNSVRGKDPVSQHQGYSRPDTHGSRAFSDDSRQPNSSRPDVNQSFNSQVRSIGYAPPGFHQGALSRIPPPKPVHTVFTNSPPSGYGVDQSEDRPPSLPPKPANQQASVKPTNVIPSQLDNYYDPQRDEYDRPRVMAARQMQVMKDDVSEPVDSAAEYAFVQKRPLQSVVSGRAVDDPNWHGNDERPERARADGAGYPSDIASRSRQSPDGTLDSPDLPASKSNSTLQPFAVNVTSSSDFGREQRPGVKASSQEDLASIPPVRPVLPSDSILAASGVPENLSASTRSEPQGGAENTDLQGSLPVLQLLTSHSQLRLTAAVLDWKKLQQDDVVRQLIRLRRSQATLEEMRYWLLCRLSQQPDIIGSSDDDSKHGEMKRQLVELEREISLTTPLIAELDSQLTGHTVAAEQMRSPASPVAEPTASSAEPAVKTMEAAPSDTAAEKLVAAVDSGLQMESPASSSRSFQVVKDKSSLQQTPESSELGAKLEKVEELERQIEDQKFKISQLREEKARLTKAFQKAQKDEDEERDAYRRVRLRQQRQALDKDLFSSQRTLAAESKRLEELSIASSRLENEIKSLRRAGYPDSMDSGEMSRQSPYQTVTGQQQQQHSHSELPAKPSDGVRLTSERVSMLPVDNTTGIGLVQDLAQEKTYLETDLNTGDCRNIAVKPKTTLPSTTKLQSSESLTVSGSDSASLSQMFPGQTGSYVAFSQPSLPEKPAASGYHGMGNTQQVAAGGYTTASGTSDVINSYAGIRNPPVTGAGFSSDDVRKFSSENSKKASHSGMYSVASSRASVQQTASQPGTDAGSWADRRLGPDTLKTGGLRDDNQRGQVAISRRDQADGMQQFGNGRQLPANVPSVPVQGPLRQVEDYNPTSSDSQNVGDRFTSHVPRDTRSHRQYPSGYGDRPSAAAPRSKSVTREVPWTDSRDYRTGRLTASDDNQVQPSRTEVRHGNSAPHPYQTSDVGVPSTGPRTADPLTRGAEFSGSSYRDGDSGKSGVDVGDISYRQLDHTTSGREVWSRPPVVNIPERYVPPHREDEQNLSSEEQQQRLEKSEKYRRMVAAQSLQEFSRGELSSHQGAVRQQVEDERRRREEMLNMRQSLAEQVSQRSHQFSAGGTTQPLATQPVVRQMLQDGDDGSVL